MPLNEKTRKKVNNFQLIPGLSQKVETTTKKIKLGGDDPKIPPEKSMKVSRMELYLKENKLKNSILISKYFVLWNSETFGNSEIIKMHAC